LLLTACGGSNGVTDFGAPESAGSQPSPAAQTWDGGDRPIDADLDPSQPQSAGAPYQRPGARPETYRPPADNYPDPTAGATGPRGTAGGGAPRADEVGYAGTRGVQGEGTDGAVVAVHRSLPAGTIVEVTNLETGRTILVLVTGAMGQGADHLIDLSPGAARQLGAASATTPVRVRRVTASPQDQNALQNGQPASDRPDTPPVLLGALRKSLPAGTAAARPSTPSYSRPVTPGRATPPRAATGGRYYVQVAALSNSGNAQGLAQSLRGFVKPGGGLYRVQMGPFRTAGEAEAARADAARRGYGDARVFTQN
jgi:rare lipoprotein A